ncbi:MAG: NAD(P)H-dependent oxidoreductase subunit E [Candidatus Omnitrophota bacterium]|jgi:NADH-quinone oxidoreductase subunit E
METIKNLELKPGLLDYIAQWKDKPGNLIMILHKAQEEYGFIPRNVAFKLAEVLAVPLAKIYGVITFYHYFKLEKRGKNIIAVCMGTACYLKGGEDIVKELETILGVSLNDMTPDGKFSIEAVRCLGCCGLAPVMSINGTVYGKLLKSQLPEILSKY